MDSRGPTATSDSSRPSGCSSRSSARRIGLMQPGLVEVVDVVILLRIGTRHAHVDDGIIVSRRICPWRCSAGAGR